MFDWWLNWTTAPVQWWHLLVFAMLIWIPLRGYIWRTHHLMKLQEDHERALRINLEARDRR